MSNEFLLFYIVLKLFCKMSGCSGGSEMELSFSLGGFEMIHTLPVFSFVSGKTVLFHLVHTSYLLVFV